MGIKYIIEMEDKPFELLSEDGLTSEKLFRVKGFNSLVFDWNGLNMLTPYTEPDLEQVRKEAYDKCMDEAEMSAYKLYSPKIDEAYQRGLSDAWDAARKIAKLDTDEQKRLFGCFGIYFVAHEYSASECVEKIRQYERGKEEQIQVGDEVNAPFGKAIVVNVDSVAEKIWFLYADGYVGIDFFKNAPTKTGRHFPEIVEVLQNMKEEA